MNAAIDMAQFVAPKSDQLNSEDLLSGPRTVRITRVSAGDSAEQPISVYYEGDNGRPWKPCKTMRRLLMHAWGRYADQYVGRSMTLYRDPTVMWAGKQEGGIRISHMSHIDGKLDVALMETRGKRKPHRVLPLETGADAGRAKAEQWVAEHIEAINTAADLAALTAVLDKGAKAREKLATGHPDLADKVQVAMSQAKDRLDPADPFDGPADTQRGEPQSLADVEQAIAKATTTDDVNAIMRAAQADLDDGDYDAALGLANERIGELA